MRNSYYMVLQIGTLLMIIFRGLQAWTSQSKDSNIQYMEEKKLLHVDWH